MERRERYQTILDKLIKIHEDLELLKDRGGINWQLGEFTVYAIINGRHTLIGECTLSSIGDTAGAICDHQTDGGIEGIAIKSVNRPAGNYLTIVLGFSSPI